MAALRNGTEWQSSEEGERLEVQVSFPERPGLPAPILLPGGKSRLVRVLLPLVPYGNDVQVYAEPYCGSAALFFAKKPHPIEVLNDLDQRLVNLFRALQDPEIFPALKHRLRYTLYSRAEFERALEILRQEGTDPVDRAWALFVARNQSFSGNMRVWGRVLTKSEYGVASSVNKWLAKLAFLDEWHQRLMMAQIDCVDALEFVEYWDTEKTFFYIDPPYHPDTWDVSSACIQAVDREHHRRLVQRLLDLKGLALVSGYYHPDYKPLEEHGWVRQELNATPHTLVVPRVANPRREEIARRKAPQKENIWISPRLARRLGLFRSRTFFDLLEKFDSQGDAQ
jgi:DNA adenine methylase